METTPFAANPAGSSSVTNACRSVRIVFDDQHTLFRWLWRSHLKRIVRGMLGPKQKKNPSMATPAELTRLFQLGLDMLFIGGFDGYFKVVNPACERVLGHPDRLGLLRTR